MKPETFLILLTLGGFGFLGKLLIEKLLRCDVKRIYLMARAKKGKSLEERFEALLQDPVSELEKLSRDDNVDSTHDSI